MNRRWICNDVWMDIFPSFDRPKLGLQMALLSFRFDVLVDKHFGGKSELTIWRPIVINKGIGPKAMLLVDWKPVALPDRPLPNKIRFKELWILYFDHSVITFLNANKQIFDRIGTKLELCVTNAQQSLDAFSREVLPIFAPTIRHFIFNDVHDLVDLRSLISPTILTNFTRLSFIESICLCPAGVFADDFGGPNATSAGQILSKWLHTPSKDGQPKRMRCSDYLDGSKLAWVNNFKEAFRRATTSVSYNVRITVYKETTPIEQFELVNERTKEKLTLSKESSGALCSSRGLELNHG